MINVRAGFSYLILLLTDRLRVRALGFHHFQVALFFPQLPFQLALLLALGVGFFIILRVLPAVAYRAHTGDEGHGVVLAVHAEQARGLSVAGLALGVYMHGVSVQILDIAHIISLADHLALPRVAQRPRAVVAAYLVGVYTVCVSPFPHSRPGRVEHSGLLSIAA